MISTTYLPHLVYSLALTSLGIHLLVQRKDAEAARGQLAAQTSILAAAAARLRAGERVPERELDRLLKLARSQRVGEVPGDTGGGGEADVVDKTETGTEAEIGWRDVLLGRRQSGDAARARAEEWDRRDLERARTEVRAEALAADR